MPTQILNNKEQHSGTLAQAAPVQIGERMGAWSSGKPFRRRRVAFVTNICPHYRRKTFELLAQHHQLDFYFFSAGDEWYLWRGHGTTAAGNFRHQYLSGIELAGARLNPTLPFKLWRGDYEVFVKCINGRIALPLTYAMARLKRKPFILWTGIWSTLQTPFHRLIQPLTQYIYHHADAIVVYGEHVKQYLIGRGVEAHKIFVAAHAVDNPAYSQTVSEEQINNLRDKLDLTPADRIVLFVGRLEEVKGLTYLVRAFSEIENPAARLVLVGEGSQSASIRSYVNDLGLTDRVRFAGYVTPEETLSYYALAQVLVLPSISTPRGKETWGLVVNEAMNQGVPVIATNAVGAAAGGLVRDGINGFVVPERDSRALSDALAKIIGCAELREEMSCNVRRIVATWDNERMVAGFCQAIEFVTSK